MKLHVYRRSLIFIFLSFLLLQGCEPVPKQALTRDARVADMASILTTFERNYSPLWYKLAAKRAGVFPKPGETGYAIPSKNDPLYKEWVALKQKYLQEARLAKDNTEFFLVQQRFFAEVFDAHTGYHLTPSLLPGVVKLGYLGFSGKRMGKHFLVTDLLPGAKRSLSFPIKPGDVITHINGVPIEKATRDTLTPYRNLGDDAATLTANMNAMFNRMSLEQPLPGENEKITLTVRRLPSDPDDEKSSAKDKDKDSEKNSFLGSRAYEEAEDSKKDKRSEDSDERETRGHEVVKVELPWIIKDLPSFQEDRANYEREQKNEEPKTRKGKKKLLGGMELPVTLLGADGDFYKLPEKTSKTAKGSPTQSALQRAMETFMVPPRITHWTTEGVPADETPVQKLRRERNVPKSAIPVEVAKTYPAYLTTETGPGGKKLHIGVIQIPTFAPSTPEVEVMKQFKETLAFFHHHGVKHLVIDTINNGGGSVSLVLKIAQALSRKKIKVPGIELGVNEYWLDSLESDVQNKSVSEPEREISRRLLAHLHKAQAEKKIMAPILPIDELIPWQLEGNHDIKEPFKIAVLINEMVASAGDLFAGMVRENELGTLVGTKTMGAGGNVATYWQTMGSRGDVRQTLSLIVVKDKPGGEPHYIENQGVPPHIAMDVSATVKDKYNAVYRRAIRSFFTKANRSKDSLIFQLGSACKKKAKTARKGESKNSDTHS